MKKIILASMMSVVFTSLAIAAEPEPGYKVLEEFRKEFPSAENASWTEEGELAKVSFVLAGKRIIAFFSNEGQLEGCVREIFYDQLPLTVMTAVGKRFGKHDVIRIREINNAEGTHYRIRLESGAKKFELQVKPDGNISSVERLK